MVLAYLVNNYDVKLVTERPKQQWLGQNQIPPLQAKMVVKRRKETV